MGWTLGTDLAAHRDVVSGFLASDPVGHTSQATILATLASGVSWTDVAPLFLAHRTADGRVDAAAVMTPPYPLVLDGAVDPDELVAALAGRVLTGVNAPEPVATAFAAAWCATQRATARPDMRVHLLELLAPGLLVEPLLPPGGHVRPATPEDLPIVIELVSAMRAEIGEQGPSPSQILSDRIAAGLLVVWESEGELLATAQASAAVHGVSRVSGVYTVPAARGRGLAAAVSAAVTRSAFAAGAQHACLFTDAANPTSNGVYERLGYRRRAEDRVVLRFTPAAASTLG